MPCNHNGPQLGNAPPLCYNTLQSQEADRPAALRRGRWRHKPRFPLRMSGGLRRRAGHFLWTTRHLRRRRDAVTEQEAKRFLANPDVSCREEGPDEGAILFNPDTDAILVINPVGLLIWRALERQPHTIESLVAVLQEQCEDVPTDRVAADVEAFLQSLLPGGFVGEVLEDETA